MALKTACESCDTLLAALVAAEETLGNNLVWIADQADLGIRQRDTETLRRLKELETGWIAIVKAIKVAERGIQ